MSNDPELIPCDHVVSQLWAYIDGELTPERTEQIRAHLEVCQRCFPQYDFQQAFVGFLAQHSAQPIPSGLRRRVFERLLAEEEKPSSWVQRLFS